MKLILALAFLALVATTHAFTWTLPARGRECFYESLQAGETLTIMYQVVQGGNLDIDLVVDAPDKNALLKKYADREGQYSVHARTAGEHSICFSNTGSFADKDIDLDIEKSSGGTDLHEEKFGPLTNILRELENHLYSVQNEQKYMKMRDQRHQHTNESTNSSVLMWSFFEAFILIGASVFQVFYLRRFLAGRKSLGR